MEAWESIEKCVDYIESNLENEITIDRLSNICNLSPFYFQKLFKRLVSKTPMEYVKLRRLARASEEIKNDKYSNIADICFKYGFENHETFTRNFKESYGMTPSQYRNNPILLSHFLKPEIYLQYKIVDEDVPIITDGMVLEVTRFSLENPRYFMGYTVNAELSAPGVDPMGDVWNKVHENKMHFENYVSDGNELGVNLNMEEGSNNTQYFAGAEVSSIIENAQCEKYVLESKNYIICKFEAENFYTLVTDAIYKVYKYMHFWINKKEIQVEPTAIELYYGSSPEKTYMELWIPII